MQSQGGGGGFGDMVTNYGALYLDSGSELKYWDWIWQNHQSFVFGTYRKPAGYGGGGGGFPTLSNFLNAAIAKYDSWWDKASTVGEPMFDYTATDASGNTQTFGTQKQAEDFISARLPVMITLPEIMIEDLHAVVQHTLDNLDYYTKSGITDFTNAGGNTMNWLATSPVAYTLGATWNSKFEGVDVFNSANGSSTSAFTLPGYGMFFPKDAGINLTTKAQINTWQNWQAHEFGHILQGRSYGPSLYYNGIVPINIFTSLLGGYIHNNLDPTEIDANRRAYNYFNQPSWWDDVWHPH